MAEKETKAAVSNNDGENDAEEALVVGGDISSYRCRWIDWTMVSVWQWSVRSMKITLPYFQETWSTLIISQKTKKNLWFFCKAELSCRVFGIHVKIQTTYIIQFLSITP